MSSLWVSIRAIFEDSKKCDMVHAGLQLMRENKTNEAYLFFKKKFNVTIYDFDNPFNYDFEIYNHNSKSINLYMQTSRNSQELKAFCKSISKSGPEYVYIELNDDMVDESESYGFIKNKKVSKTKIKKAISLVDQEFAFQIALEDNDQKVAAALLKKGINPNLKIKKTAILIHCIINQQERLANTLIDLGANTDIKIENPIDDYDDYESYRGNTLLHLCVNEELPKIAKRLISMGANINALNQFKDTPLHLAVLNSNLNIVKMLIEAGAEINPFNSEKLLPIHNAVEVSIDGDTRFLEILIKAGADINAKDQNGQQPLISWLSRCYDNHKVILVHAYSDKNSLSKIPGTIKSIEKKIENTFKLFEKNGANIYETDHFGGNLLWYSEIFPSLKKYLIKNGLKNMEPENAYSGIQFKNPTAFVIDTTSIISC